MGSRRIIASLIVCIAAALAAMPAVASAGSLLSGYGGPGQGSQVILGAALVKGTRGGGGSQGGSQTGGGSTATGESSAIAAGRPADGTGSKGKTPSRSASRRRARRAAGRGKQGKAPTGANSSTSAPVRPASPGGPTVRPAAEGSDTLGVSGIDLLYILLALGALILTGVLTKRIAGTSVPAEGTGS